MASALALFVSLREKPTQLLAEPQRTQRQHNQELFCRACLAFFAYLAASALLRESGRFSLAAVTLPRQSGMLGYSFSCQASIQNAKEDQSKALGLH